MSGANNRNDDGSKRLGDILYRPAIVEVKLRKSNVVIKRANETRELAEEHGLPFLHLESMLGDKRTWALVTDIELMDVAIAAIKRHIEHGATTSRKEVPS